MIDAALAALPFGFTFLVIYGALSDLSSFRIPNWVSYGLVALFIAGQALSTLKPPLLPTLDQWQTSAYLNIAVALVVFAVSATFWKLRLIGGGDVKYITSISLWMGIKLALPFIVLTTVIALVFVALLKLLGKWEFLLHGKGVPKFVRTLLSKIAQNELPYGFPIGVAALILIPSLFRL